MRKTRKALNFSTPAGAGRIVLPASTGGDARRPHVLMGRHGPMGEVTWWDDHMPALTFLRSIERIAPQVMDSLHGLDLGDGPGLLAWAGRWNINAPWVLDAAAATLASPLSRATWTRPKVASLQPRPKTDPEEDAFGSDLHRPADPEHMEWLVRWQVLGESVERIAKACLPAAAGDDELTQRVRNLAEEVRGVVRQNAEYLNLPPRPRGAAGRPRGVRSRKI